MRKSKSKKFNLHAFILNEAKKLQAKSVRPKRTSVRGKKRRSKVNTLDQEVNSIKKLNLKESKLNSAHENLVREMKKVQSMKRTLKKRILKKI